MFKPAQPISSLPLLYIRLPTNVVAENDHWEEHRMADLWTTSFKVLRTIDNVGAGCSFAESRSNTIVYIV